MDSSHFFSHYTLTPVFPHIVNTSELTVQWQKILGHDAIPR